MQKNKTSTKRTLTDLLEELIKEERGPITANQLKSKPILRYEQGDVVCRRGRDELGRPANVHYNVTESTNDGRWVKLNGKDKWHFHADFYLIMDSRAELRYPVEDVIEETS